MIPKPKVHYGAMVLLFALFFYRKLYKVFRNKSSKSI